MPDTSSPAADTATPVGHLLTLLAVGNFAIGMGAFVVIGILGPLTTGLGVDKSTASEVLTVYALAYAISSPVLAALTGHLDRRTVLAGGLGLFLCGIILSALSPNLSLLLLARIVTAVGAGLFTPATAAVAVATSSPAGRGGALATVFGGLTLAQVAGVPLGSWLGFAYGWQAAFIVVAVLASLALCGVIVLVPKRIPFQPTGLPTLFRTLGDPLAAIAVLFTSTFLGAAYMVFTFLGTLLAAKYGLGRDGVTALLVLYGGGAVVGNMLGGRLASRIGPFRTLLILGISQAILMPILTYPDLGIIFGGFVLVVWAISTWAFMAPQQVRLVTLVPTAQSVVLALNASAIYVGAALGSAAAAGVLPFTEMNGLGFAAAIGGLIAIGHLLLSERQARQANLLTS